MTPRVSCVVTAYNVERFVAEALESALAQDWEGAAEVIVVDDGSTDGTSAVLDRYRGRVTVIRQPNAGVAAATSAGLAAARGDLVWLLDGDDVAPPDRVRRQVELLDANPAVGLAHGDMHLIDETGAILHPSFFGRLNVQPSSGDVFGRVLRGNFVSGGASMFRASFRDRYLPIPTGFGFQDWWIVLRIAEVAPIELVAGSLNAYRRHGGNAGLDAAGPRLALAKRQEMAGRRWILANLSGSRASVADLAECFLALQRHACQVAGIEGELPGSAIAVSADETCAADSAHAAARADAQAGELERAARRCLQALGHDPFHRAQLDLQYCLHLLRERGELSRSGAPLPPPDLVTRGFVVLASAEELALRPALLSAFAASAEQPETTLLVVGDPALVGGALARAGLADDETLDVLAVPASTDEERRRLAAAAHARLGAARLPGAARLRTLEEAA